MAEREPSHSSPRGRAGEQGGDHLENQCVYVTGETKSIPGDVVRTGMAVGQQEENTALTPAGEEHRRAA